MLLLLFFVVVLVVFVFGLGSIIYDLLQKKKINCEFIYSGSANQSQVAKRWNNNLLRVLITTTLGLVGNESSRTQLVCIVGILYNLPSIIQAYGRIRPKRRMDNSLCTIYTSTNNYGRLKSVEDETTNTLNELIGCKIVSSGNTSKYHVSMTMNAVHNWLFKDQGCRLVSLAGRLGFRHRKCNLCDFCTDTCVRISSTMKRKQTSNSNLQKRMGEQLLARLKHKCLCCNSDKCNGTCVVTKVQGVTCYHCLGSHYASKCKKEYKHILKGKACYSCYVYNYTEGSIHDYTECSGDGGIKERLRGLIHYDYLEKRRKKETQMSFLVHLSGIFSSVDSFFMFLYKYRDWK